MLLITFTISPSAGAVVHAVTTRNTEKTSAFLTKYFQESSQISYGFTRSRQMLALTVDNSVAYDRFTGTGMERTYICSKVY